MSLFVLCELWDWRNIGFAELKNRRFLLATAHESGSSLRLFTTIWIVILCVCLKLSNIFGRGLSSFILKSCWNRCNYLLAKLIILVLRIHLETYRHQLG